MVLAWETAEFIGIDYPECIELLFGLLPLIFGAFLFALIAISIPPGTNKNQVWPAAKIYFRIARQRSQ